MKKSSYSNFLFIFLFFTFIIQQVDAQNEPIIAYVTVQSNKMGQIKGPGNAFGKKDVIECIGFNYSVQAQVDQASGMISGKRQQSPIVIVKHMDIATPLLLQSVYTNEVLKSITIDLVRKGSDGKWTNFETITLSNASVTRVSQFCVSSSQDKLLPNSNPL